MERHATAVVRRYEIVVLSGGCGACIRSVCGVPPTGGAPVSVPGLRPSVLGCGL